MALTAVPTSSGGVAPDIFVEIVRDERHGGLALNFRRKGRPVDGQAFFCLCQADLATQDGSLFHRLASSTKDLKLVAVQVDSFHHTGTIQCGYCTVQQSVGTSKLRNIKPNVPYMVAITIRAERFSKRALTGTSGRSSANNPAPQAVDRLGDDLIPFVDKVQLRELREQSSRLRPAFHVVGRSPWNDNLIPSLECVRYLSWQFHAFLKKNTIHMRKLAGPGSLDNHCEDDVSPAGGPLLSVVVGGTAAASSTVPAATTTPVPFLLERQLLIHGVTDPLCGVFVSFALTMSDVVRKFRLTKPPTGFVTREHPGDLCLGSPPGPPPSAGDVLETISVFGSRVQHSTLSASWTVDWYDLLLLACLDGPSLHRARQVASQFKSYDIESQPIASRLAWMLRPEKRAAPQGSLIRLFIAEAERLRLEPEVTPAHMTYVACPLSPARALWTCMTHRQQVRAMFYATPHATLLDEVTNVRKVMLQPSVVQPLFRKVRRGLARGRFVDWIRFVKMCQARRQYRLQREAMRTQEMLSMSVSVLVENSRLVIMREYLTVWLRFRSLRILVVPMEKRLQLTHLRQRFRLWRIACVYNIRIPRHLTIAAQRSYDGCIPMPNIWIRRVRRMVEEKTGRAPSTVFYNIGNGNPTIQFGVVSEPRSTAQRRWSSPSLAGGNTRLFYALAEVTRQRQMFEAYRLWHRFSEIASQLRAKFHRQHVAILSLAQSSADGTRRILFRGWQQIAQKRKHQRSIMQPSTR